MREGSKYLTWQLVSQRLRRQPMLVLKWVSGGRNALLTRSRFYTGDFEGALKKATLHLKARPDDSTIRLFAICAAIESGNFECAAQHMEFIDPAKVSGELEQQLPCLRYMVTKADHSQGVHLAVKHFDEMFVRIGCRPVRLGDCAAERVFDSLTSEVRVDSLNLAETVDYRPVERGPLVSVVMTAFNVEEFVGTSVSSILNQSYRPLELIVVDDGSRDGTVEALRRLQKDDARLKIIAKPTNDGTYVSKNVGFAQARGEYVAFQDGDDWSHPDRIGKCVAVLEARSEVLALSTEHVRMSNSGDLAITASGRCKYLSHISLFLRRREVLDRAGFFDSVRAAADAEYRERLKILFGEQGVVDFPWLLNFTRLRSGSLTAGSDFRLVRGVAGPVRMRYRKSYMRWHARIRKGGSGYLGFPLAERPFAAPEVMLPDSGAQS